MQNRQIASILIVSPSDGFREGKSLSRPKTSHRHAFTSRGLKEIVAGLDRILSVRVVFRFTIWNTGVQKMH